MAMRYRFRRVDSEDPNEWSAPIRLRRVMRRVRRQQRRHPGPDRFRRRSRNWQRWYQVNRLFRLNVRGRLWRANVGVFQVQYGGPKGPKDAILKYRLPRQAMTPGERVIAWARSQIGVPYDFGEANGPEDPGKDEYDCSGFTQVGWDTEGGVFLPHQAELQRTAWNVDFFTNESQCQPGDLVFFNFPNSRGIFPPKASHVGYWMSPGKTIDTRSPERPVAIRDIEQGSVVGYGHPRQSQQR
jgi:cell wall-associated NlpC family hydrolase